MKLYKPDNVTNRFWNGETDLEEEKGILHSWLDSEVEIPWGSYANYVRESRKAPPNLEDAVWEQIEARSKKVLPVVSRWSIAASIALIIGLGGFFLSNYQNNKINAEFQQLETALHFASDRIVNQNETEIVYEDDLIVILAIN